MTHFTAGCTSCWPGHFADMFWRRLAFGLALLTGVAAAVAADIPDHVRFPQSSGAWRRAANGALESGNASELTSALKKLAEMGATLRAETYEKLKSSIGEVADRDDLDRRFAANRSAKSDSASFASIPADYRLVEGVAWDAATGRLFIGTVVDGRLAFLQHGKWHDVALAGPRSSIFGMALDKRHSRIWLAMATVEQSAVDAPEFTGIVAVDLKALKIVARAATPPSAVGAMPNDLTVASDGTVYVSDAKTGSILQCKPGCSRLSVLTSPGTISSAQGIVALPDGRRLIVADYRNGLWLVDRTTGKASILGSTFPAMLDGVDGLLLDPKQKQLIAVQNGTSPRRIVRLQMTGTWDRVAKVAVIEQNSSEWGEPTLLSRYDGREFIYIADGQWERYGAKGSLTDKGALRETPVRRAFLVPPASSLENHSQ